MSAESAPSERHAAQQAAMLGGPADGGSLPYGAWLADCDPETLAWLAQQEGGPAEGVAG